MQNKAIKHFKNYSGFNTAARIDFLKVRFGIRTFPACFARFLTDLYCVGRGVIGGVSLF
jgi:hypothetical protein